MQSNGFVSVSSLIRELAQICQQALTGCLYFVSSDNHVGKFVLRQGEIILVRYHLETDRDALKLIKNLDQVKYHFSDRDISKSLRSESLPQNKSILLLLGFDQRPRDVAQQATPGQNEDNSVQGLSDAIKARIQEQLIAYIGPIATVLCQQAFATSDDLTTVLKQLAEHISDPEEAKAFLQVEKTF
ncbi:MAG: hypothetical protein AAFN42_20200 [Cyanobacteria bacterium J06554_1]